VRLTINAVVHRTAFPRVLEIAAAITHAANKRSGHALCVVHTRSCASLKISCVLVGEIIPVEVDATNKLQSPRTISV
jgi:hypothetical protein